MSFDTQEEKQPWYFQNWYFSKLFLWFHEQHNQVKCRLKNQIISELLTIKSVEYRIVTFLPAQSLHLMPELVTGVWQLIQKNHEASLTRKIRLQTCSLVGSWSKYRIWGIGLNFVAFASLIKEFLAQLLHCTAGQNYIFV